MQQPPLDDLGLPATQEPILRITTMPNDANAKGDIFGGWLMSKIDIAGGLVAKSKAGGMVSTVAVKELLFRKPLFVYDLVSFYAEVVKIGYSSITIHISVYAQRQFDPTGDAVFISDATLVYVAIEKPGVKRKI